MTQNVHHLESTVTYVDFGRGFSYLEGNAVASILTFPEMSHAAL